MSRSVLVSPDAVRTLAVAAGMAPHAGEVMRRTAGHVLSVVESLGALASGEAGVPASLAAAVEARVSRLAAAARDLVLGASVLRGRLDPRLLAGLLDIDEVAAVRRCEDVVRAGLLQRVGAHYEFANDLAQECVLRSPAPAPMHLLAE